MSRADCPSDWSDAGCRDQKEYITASSSFVQKRTPRRPVGSCDETAVTDMVSKLWTILVSFVKSILSMIVNHI